MLEGTLYHRARARGFRITKRSTSVVRCVSRRVALGEEKEGDGGGGLVALMSRVRQCGVSCQLLSAVQRSPRLRFFGPSLTLAPQIQRLFTGSTVYWRMEKGGGDKTVLCTTAPVRPSALVAATPRASPEVPE